MKVIAFDIFNTVLDASHARPEDRQEYVDHVKRCNATGSWGSLDLVVPESWERLPPFPDSVEGIKRLRSSGLKVVALSNWPAWLTGNASRFNGIEWDEIIDLRYVRAFKPQLRTYAYLCDVMKVKPCDVLMVTGNPGAGDDERPKWLGMQTQVIRGESDVKTIIELAERLEVSCEE
jgi:FMN phosphatase YigB (HAD superfamily)